MTSKIEIVDAMEADREFVTTLMENALAPFYDGDHIAHARRIFDTHVTGGKDQIGFFSTEQRMFLVRVDGKPAGMIHLVGKRQQTYKISPLIVADEYRGTLGLGSSLLNHAENVARNNGARQIYCTVAEQNKKALQFFLRHGFLIGGKSHGHYKTGVDEVMLYKVFLSSDDIAQRDRPHISILPATKDHYPSIRRLLLEKLPKYFFEIDDKWVDALFDGYERKSSRDVNKKYKILFVALDSSRNLLGVAGGTPKKGEPIKLMPFVATTLPAFEAILTDIPFHMKEYGRKLYMHIIPTVAETIALQQRHWKLDAALPAAYHVDHVTQQWGLDLDADITMRTMRVKQKFLDYIIRGQKDLEVRVGYESIRGIQPGEKIRLVCHDREQVVKVKSVRKYATFEDMLEHEDAERIVPEWSREQVTMLLKEIYPPEKEQLGVIVLDIKAASDLAPSV